VNTVLASRIGAGGYHTALLRAPAYSKSASGEAGIVQFLHRAEKRVKIEMDDPARWSRGL
jgi:hypothetical protein